MLTNPIRAFVTGIAGATVVLAANTYGDVVCDGCLFVAQYYANDPDLEDRCVKRFDLPQNNRGCFVTEHLFERTHDVLFTPDGQYLLVTTGHSNQDEGGVQSYDPDTGMWLGTWIDITTFPPDVGMTDMDFGPNGKLYVAAPHNDAAGKVLEYDLGTGTYSIIIDGLTKNWGLAVAPNGNVFTAEWDADTVTEYVENGGIWQVANVISEGLVRPEGLAFDCNGHLYVGAEGSVHKVLEYVWSGSAWVKQDREFNVSAPRLATLGPDGNIYFASGSKVVMCDLSSPGPVGTVQDVVTSNLRSPYAVTFRVCGNGVCDPDENPCFCPEDCSAAGSTWLCGTAFEDLNGDCQDPCDCSPDAGEELANIEIVVEFEVDMTSCDGRFAIELPTAGGYTITARYQGDNYRKWFVQTFPGVNFCNLEISKTAMYSVHECAPEVACGTLAASQVIPVLSTATGAALIALEYCDLVQRTNPIAWVTGTIILVADVLHYVFSVGGQEPLIDPILGAISCAESALWDFLEGGGARAPEQSAMADDVWEGFRGPWGPMNERYGASLGVFAANTVDVRVTDEKGRALEYNDDPSLRNGLEQPGWVSRSSANSQLAFVLEPIGAYTVELHGVPEAGAGDTFDLQVMRQHPVDAQWVHTFVAVPISSTGMAKIDVGESIAPTLQVDVDGDGVFELAKEPDDIAINGLPCVDASDCNDGDYCTSDSCDTDIGNCSNAYVTRPYGDVTPFGSITPPCPADPHGELGDGFANMLDVFCAFNAFNEGNPYTECPCADVAPCGGDSFVNMQDVFAIFSAFNESPACSDPCP